MRICLVRSGTKYGPEYVSALTRQAKEHAPDARVFTLTDQDDTPGAVYPLKMGWPGWWAKLECFAPHTRDLRPFLFIDLDSFVLAEFDHLDCGDEFTMVRDFNGWVVANSSVMWIPKDVDHIWDEFTKDPERHMAQCGGKGDQEFLGRFHDNLWEPLEVGVTSYKNHGTQEPVGCIMQFHGQPKPCDAGGWATARWEQYA